MACGVRMMGPMVVWQCEVDPSRFLQGSFLQRLASHNWVSATECYVSRFYVSDVRVEGYICFITKLRTLINECDEFEQASGLLFNEWYRYLIKEDN